MRTFSKIALAFILTLSLVGVSQTSQAKGNAYAKASRSTRLSPQKMRVMVSKYRTRHGVQGKFRMHGVAYSQSGLSRHVAVANTNGSVNLLTVHATTGRVSAGQTGLVSQSTARGKAHLHARRERGAKGAFSGVFKSGLSKSGRSYKFTSKTDRNEHVYVNIRRGTTRHMDGPYHHNSSLSSMAKAL